MPCPLPVPANAGGMGVLPMPMDFPWHGHPGRELLPHPAGREMRAGGAETAPDL
jgi:hypothetical protein